jgi:hypothetical protein
LLEVAHEAAVFDEPGERALDDPAARERLEADQGSGSFDDGERDVGLRPCPGFETTGIAAVPEHGLNKGERRAGGLERELGAVAVLDIGGVDANGEQPPVRVGQDMALATGDLLGGVIAPRTPLWSAVRTDWLSMMAAVGLGSRPARSRSAVRARW